MVARVAVASAIYAIDKPYSYRIPDGMDVCPGVRVIVPFGRGDRRSEGIILDICDEKEEGLKSIAHVLDRGPIMSVDHIRLAAFLRERYFCTFYDAIKAMLPAGLWFDTSERYERTERSWERAQLSSLEAQILRAADDMGNLTLTEAKKLFDAADLAVTLHSLVKKGYLRSDLNFSRKVKDKTEKSVSLAVPAEQALEYAQSKRRSAPLQTELLKLLCTVGRAGAKELCYLTGATSQTIRRLEELGYIECTIQEILRSPLPAYVEPAGPITLTQEQQTAYEALLRQSEDPHPGVALLYGVTGSGKTSVYIELIRQTLERGKSALLLVPEIALTPQLIGVLMSHFGDTVAVLHSALRVSERYDAWKKIKQGLSRVVIGTRSAVFAPIVDPGLFIIDEEQEHTYRSENTPRYHAREVAIYRGTKEGALVVLGSATPSVETMHLAKEGIYSLNVISSRYNGKHLPNVELIDMKQELKNGNATDLSAPLVSAIAKNIADGHQSILFLNRRGAGRCMICVDCGEVYQCPACSVSLIYHKVNGRLMCHHCGYSRPAAERCEACGGHVKVIGTGTQRVEQQLKQIFPEVEVLRMDADTISVSNPHEVILKRFEEEKIPILIGTQMVTKGLNFENVTLVGVIDADMSLYVDHFRASETTFSMLTQVIGRSGRGCLEGRALVQTYTPEHAVLKLAAKQDYDGFFALEDPLRKMQAAPPYGDLLTLTFSSLLEDAARNTAYDFRRMLEAVAGTYGLRILGPAPAAVLKVNHTYRYRVTVCCKNSKEIRSLIAACLKEFGKNKKYKGVTAYADVNSYE